MILSYSSAFWAVLALVALGAGIAVRVQLARRRRGEESQLPDEAIHQIEAEGRLTVEEVEALDWEEIRRGEERFWANPFDGAEPFSEDAPPDGGGST